jgi:hypothetical protein
VGRLSNALAAPERALLKIPVCKAIPTLMGGGNKVKELAEAVFAAKAENYRSKFVHLLFYICFSM